MESKEIIAYKWQEGIYSLEDLMILVQFNKLSEKEFFEITRFNYEGLLQSKAKKQGRT